MASKEKKVFIVIIIFFLSTLLIVFIEKYSKTVHASNTEKEYLSVDTYANKSLQISNAENVNLDDIIQRNSF